MGPGDFVIIALWTWLLPSTNAGPVRRVRELTDEAVPCLTYRLDGLIHVDCTDRELTELPDGINTNVQVLLLSNNNFVAYPPQLEQFTELEILDFSSNHLSVPLPSYMEQLEKLHTLNLSNNNYDVWVATRINSIIRLDLSKNKISRIDDTAFSTLRELRLLDLSENRLYQLPSSIFQSLPRLESLMLSRNYFSSIPAFQSYSLRNLDLKSCQISGLEENSLYEMPSILELYLSMNQIESIPDNLASNTLQTLDLSYNDIGSLNDYSFSSLPHLAVLDLRGNAFRDVWSTSHFGSNPNLREVHVKGNRWSCEGFHVNLLLTYEFLTKEPQKVTDAGSLICYSPQNVTQMSWQQAYIRTWHPNEDSPASYTTMAVFIGVIIGVLITSIICRGLLSVSRVDPPSQSTVVNVTPQPAAETVVMRVPLRDEDLPPTYDEALLMPRLNSSFHSLPDFIDDDDEEDTDRYHRRSRSIGDLTEYRPVRTHDRRSVRRTVQFTANGGAPDNLP